MREREQPLQITSNRSLESSGKYSPFCAHTPDVPVHLLAEVGKAPLNRLRTADRSEVARCLWLIESQDGELETAED